MSKAYKLKEEVKQFIIEKKKAEPKFSCRSMVTLIKERFNIDISKSTINTIIKENSLSSKVGRPRIRVKKTSVLPVNLDIPPKAPSVSSVTPKNEPLFESVSFGASIAQPPKIEEEQPSPQAVAKARSVEIREIEAERVYIENGGALFMLMADYKSGFTGLLAKKIMPYLPDLSQEMIRLLIQARVYGQIIEDEESLWKFLGKELSGAYLAFYFDQLTKIPFELLNQDFIGLGLERNINQANTLYRKIILYLNGQVQNKFLPPVYLYLDFSAMWERFYSLVARIENHSSGIIGQFLYPPGFKAIHDIVWQEDFRAAVNALNKERVFTPEGKLFRFEDTLVAYH